MIDIHSHLMFKVDDGAKSFAESMRLLLNAEKEGITDVIFTPHFIKNGEYRKRADELKAIFDIFQKGCQNNGLQIRLHLGNVLYIHPELDHLLESGEILTLNQSKYILVEFPFTKYSSEYDDILFNLKMSGYRVIIAHPERYSYVQNNVSFVERWVSEGFLLQINQSSLFKKETKDICFRMIEDGKVYFCASNAHSEHRPCTLKDAYHLIEKNMEGILFIEFLKSILN